MSRVIGIDLGTTNSCVTVLEGGKPHVIANAEGAHTTPSTVGFAASGERLVGQVAKRQAVTNPQRTVSGCKRLIGRKYDSDEVRRFAELAPFEIIEGGNGDAWLSMDGESRPPQEIASLVLASLVESASEFLGEPVHQAVITVPAYFNDAQRQATKEAGRIAGLDVLRIVNEPTAAALAYGLAKQEARRVAVFDLGGGTFDVSILEVGDGVVEVRSTNGDTYLGGEDFDARIVEYLARLFEREHGIDLREDCIALQRLKEAAERAKHELSSCEEVHVNLPFIQAADSGPLHLVNVLTRETVDALVADLINALEAPCLHALEDAQLRPDDLDEVILVGGMTRMPAVRQKVIEILGKEPEPGVNPDEVVAMGAAIQAGVLNGQCEEVLLLDVTSLSLGVETQGGVFTQIIERNTTIPSTRSRIFSTTEDGQTVVRVHVLQGERKMAADNVTLGRFELLDLPPAPRGVPQIEVTFSIDEDGVVHVSARERGTGREQGIRVTASSGLNPTEVERLIGEAEQNAESDAQRHEWVDMRNRCEGLIYSTSRTLEEFSARIGEEDRSQVESALEKARVAMTEDSLEHLRMAVEELSTLTYRVTEKLYA